MMESREYFVRPGNIWFPDLEEVLASTHERFANYPKQPFLNIVDMVAYFRGELSRERFAARFLAQTPPEKTLKKDLELYRRAKSLCEAYGEGSLGAEEFDAQLLLALRHKPEEDVFVPAAEVWKETEELVCRLERKGKYLPVDFDSISWRAYLIGNITRSAFAELICASNAAERLAQGPAYGNDKALFSETYAREIAACRKLYALCAEFRDGESTPADFDGRFLELAEEFCA